MDFSYTDKTNQLRTRVHNFMQDHIIPRIGQWRDEVQPGQTWSGLVCDTPGAASPPW